MLYSLSDRHALSYKKELHGYNTPIEDTSGFEYTECFWYDYGDAISQESKERLDRWMAEEVKRRKR